MNPDTTRAGRDAHGAGSPLETTAAYAGEGIPVLGNSRPLPSPWSAVP